MADVPKDLLDQINELERLFTVDREKLKQITEHFVSELKRGEIDLLNEYDLSWMDTNGSSIGLSENGATVVSSIKPMSFLYSSSCFCHAHSCFLHDGQAMNPTWVMAYPTGYETGTYLALDMGGTNLRVCEIELPKEKGEFDITQSKYRMPAELKTGNAEELWEYIADCVQQFVEYHHEGEQLSKMHLGFTFSYPATQDYIDHAVLQRWTKGFDIDGVEGKDVVPMFEAALAKRVSTVITRLS